MYWLLLENLVCHCLEKLKVSRTHFCNIFFLGRANLSNTSTFHKYISSTLAITPIYHMCHIYQFLIAHRSISICIQLQNYVICTYQYFELD